MRHPHNTGHRMNNQMLIDRVGLALEAGYDIMQSSR